MSLPLDSSAPTDFDFFIGRWKVAHRRLKARLAGCTEWETFSGACVVQKILGGFGNVDDNILEIPSGTYRALSIRSFDAQAGTWSIWWLDGRRPGTLDVPVVGRFVNEVGTFFTEDTLGGEAHSRAVPMDTAAPRVAPLGAGVFARRRGHVGDELGDGLHSELTGDYESDVEASSRSA